MKGCAQKIWNFRADCLESYFLKSPRESEKHFFYGEKKTRELFPIAKHGDSMTIDGKQSIENTNIGRNLDIHSARPNKSRLCHLVTWCRFCVYNLRFPLQRAKENLFLIAWERKDVKSLMGRRFVRAFVKTPLLQKVMVFFFFEKNLAKKTSWLNTRLFKLD